MDLTLGSSFAFHHQDHQQQQQVQQQQQQHQQRLEEYMKALQKEKLKIEALCRELPCCMQLLDEAIDKTREEYTKARRITRKLELFEDLKTCKGEDSAHCSTDHLQDKKSDVHLALLTTPHIQKQEQSSWAAQSQLSSPCSSSLEQLNNSSSPIKLSPKGAFAPFVGSKKWEHLKSGSSELRLSPTLASSSAPSPLDQMRNPDDDRVYRCGESDLQQIPSIGFTQSQQQRKARRCWSPELHRRFVNALQQLGGSQVATPKQIRELMKVEGLTNDEVKSHLQKYRLHTRRPGSTSQAPQVTQSPQVVVLGSIWVPQEYAAAVAAQNSSLFHEAHQQFQQVPREFFTNLTQPPPSLYYDQQQRDGATSPKNSCEDQTMNPTKAGEDEDDGDLTEAESSGDLGLQMSFPVEVNRSTG